MSYVTYVLELYKWNEMISTWMIMGNLYELMKAWWDMNWNDLIKKNKDIKANHE